MRALDVLIRSRDGRHAWSRDGPEVTSRAPRTSPVLATAAALGGVKAVPAQVPGNSRTVADLSAAWARIEASNKQPLSRAPDPRAHAVLIERCHREDAQATTRIIGR
jgi:hypothetical protein